MSIEPSTAHPSATDVDARLADVILSLAGVAPDELTDELRLVHDLGFDSLGLIELVTALEVEFDLPVVPDEQALGIETVGDVRALLGGAR